MKRRGQSRGRAGRAWKCFGRSGPPRFPARPKGVGSRPRRLAESRETTDEGTPSSRSTLDRRGRHAGSPGFALKYQYPRSIRREGARLGCAPISSSMLPPDMLRRETRTGAFPARRARVRSAVRADIVPSRGVQWHATQRLAVALLKEGVENPGERGQIQAGDELTRHCLSNHVAV